jgi:hypothetical protein
MIIIIIIIIISTVFKHFQIIIFIICFTTLMNNLKFWFFSTKLSFITHILFIPKNVSLCFIFFLKHFSL